MAYNGGNSRLPILPKLPQKRYYVPFFLVALGAGSVVGQVLQGPVTELRLLDTETTRDRAAAGQPEAAPRERRGMTTAGTRLTLPEGSATSVVAHESPSHGPRRQAVDPAGATRIRLILSKPVPAPPRRLTPPPTRPEIATTWVPAGQVRLDGAPAASPAAPPVEGGSVCLTFHAAQPGVSAASTGRFPEDARPVTTSRPAWHQSQPVARPGAAEPGPGWPLNPLRVGGSWRGR